MQVFDKVLILSASAGAGHVRAGQAMERAFLEAGAARSVRHLDTLGYTNPLFRRLYSRAYIETVNRMPELLGLLYDWHDKPGQVDYVQLAFDRLNTRPFAKMMEEYQPEVTICTHFLPAEIITWLNERGRLATRVMTVVTDFDIHSQWICSGTSHYFVAIDETRAHLEALGIPPERLTVSGIPIDPIFSRPRDRDAMRAKHGLDREGPVILISAGGFGVGKIDALIASLLKLRHPAQVVAICGRNEERKAELEALAKDRPLDSRVRIHVIGYTTEIDELMAAADLIVGKPGGLTTSESLACGLAFVVVDPIPGQEERNSDHLLEEGAALRCNNLPALAYKIDRLLDDPARLATLRQNALRLARPRAAFDIVAKVDELRRLNWSEEE
jgi:processive 1,2-diacylglycerol beta-glucosyltransferase